MSLRCKFKEKLSRKDFSEPPFDIRRIKLAAYIPQTLELSCWSRFSLILNFLQFLLTKSVIWNLFNAFRVNTMPKG